MLVLFCFKLFLLLLSTKSAAACQRWLTTVRFEFRPPSFSLAALRHRKLSQQAVRVDSALRSAPEVTAPSSSARADGVLMIFCFRRACYGQLNDHIRAMARSPYLPPSLCDLRPTFSRVALLRPAAFCALWPCVTSWKLLYPADSYWCYLR